jgi:hypothetical protein
MITLCLVEVIFYLVASGGQGGFKFYRLGIIDPGSFSE